MHRGCTAFAHIWAQHALQKNDESQHALQTAKIDRDIMENKLRRYKDQARERANREAEKLEVFTIQSIMTMQGSISLTRYPGSH